MEHLIEIQSEFIHLAGLDISHQKWRSMSYDQQVKYLKAHPKSLRHITKSPSHRALKEKNRFYNKRHRIKEALKSFKPHDFELLLPIENSETDKKIQNVTSRIHLDSVIGEGLRSKIKNYHSSDFRDINGEYNIFKLILIHKVLEDLNIDDIIKAAAPYVTNRIRYRWAYVLPELANTSEALDLIINSNVWKNKVIDAKNRFLKNIENIIDDIKVRYSGSMPYKNYFKYYL